MNTDKPIYSKGPIREDPCKSVARGLACTARKRQQRDIARLLDRRRQPVLMRRAHARQAARHDFAALCHKLPEQSIVLVVDVLDLFDTELANLLAPEEFASAGATLAPGPARTTSRTAKSRTISAR